MNADIKAKWLEALRSGEYQQGRRQLRKGDTYCCLGVLCDLHRKETGEGEWGGVVFDSNPYKTLDNGVTDWEDGTLPGAVREWAGLRDENPILNDIAIAVYNDGDYEDNVEPHTFAEIADLIEAHL